MKIRTIAIAIALLAGSAAVHADKAVKGYVKKDGTIVQPHYRSSSNKTKTDNYSTKGNTNPYTGKQGTKDPYKPAKPKY